MLFFVISSLALCRIISSCSLASTCIIQLLLEVLAGFAVLVCKVNMIYGDGVVDLDLSLFITSCVAYGASLVRAVVRISLLYLLSSIGLCWYAAGLILEVVTSTHVVLLSLQLIDTHGASGSSGLIKTLLTLSVLGLGSGETLLEAEGTWLNAQLVVSRWLLTLTLPLETLISCPVGGFVGGWLVKH